MLPSALAQWKPREDFVVGHLCGSVAARTVAKSAAVFIMPFFETTNTRKSLKHNSDISRPSFSKRNTKPLRTEQLGLETFSLENRWESSLSLAPLSQHYEVDNMASDWRGRFAQRKLVTKFGQMAGQNNFSWWFSRSASSAIKDSKLELQTMNDRSSLILKRLKRSVGCPVSRRLNFSVWNSELSRFKKSF